MNSEEKARGCLTKAQTLKESGNYKDAIAALQPLSDYQVHWSPVFIAAIDLLGELCFSQEQDVHVDSFFPAFKWSRIKLRGSQHLVEGTKKIVDITLKHLRNMNERARANVKATEENPGEEELILASLSGVSPSQRAKERYLIPAESITQMVGSELLNFNVIGHSKRVLPTYLDTVLELIKICQEFNMKRAIGRIADATVRFFKRFLWGPINPMSRNDNPHLVTLNKELETDREDFYKEKQLMERTVQVFCSVLRSVTTMNHWHGSWTVMQCFAKIMQEIAQRPDPSRECQINAYLAMADVFWKCSHYAFYAHCLGLAAFLTDKDAQLSLASKAVLATLCVPDINREKKSFARGSDYLFEKNARIAQLFGLQSAPAGKFLWERLQRMQVVSKALPQVQALDEFLRNEVVNNNFAEVAMMQVSAIVEKNSELQMYQEPLRKVIMQKYLECMASQTTRVDTLSLQMGLKGASEDLYIHETELFILNESGIAVEIDHKTMSLSFSNTAKAKVLGAFDTLAEKVDIQPAASRKKIEISFELLQRAHDRSSIIHSLQHLCERTAEARLKSAKDLEEKHREEKRQDRVDAENKRREDARKAQEARGLAEHQEYINKERRKLVVRRLKEKYKGYTLNELVAQKNSTDFVQEVTITLRDYLKKNSEEKMADVTKMNHFERACRELENPKRKAIELEEAEQYKAERAAARENFFLQHRKEFDKRQQDNEILKKFLKEAGVFVEQIQSKSKISKRDEQQTLLEREKERLQGF